MKSKVICLVFLLSNYSSPASAQQKNNSGISYQNLLSDTTFITATEITLAPGQKTETHTLPAYFFYALTPCSLNIHFADGKTESYEMKAGGNNYSGPDGPHYTENVGKKTARFLIVGLKEHPYSPNGKTTAK